MENQDKQTENNSNEAYMPNENFENWEEKPLQRRSGRPRPRKKQQRNYELPKGAKNRTNPAVSNFISEGNPNTEDMLKETETHPPFQSRPGDPWRGQNEYSSQEKPAHGSSVDQQLAQFIEAAIANEESIAADNNSLVRVVVEHGIVTLEGAVSSEQHKRIIEDKAVDFVGAGKVINQVEVRKD